MQKDKKIDIKKIIAQKEIELKQWYDTHLERQKLWKISLWALIVAAILDIRSFLLWYLSVGIDSKIAKITLTGLISIICLIYYVRANLSKISTKDKIIWINN